MTDATPLPIVHGMPQEPPAPPDPKNTVTPLPPWLDRQAFPFAPTLVDVGEAGADGRRNVGAVGPQGERERLSCVDIGAGHPVLFSHGTPTWSYEWRHLLSALAPHYRCIAPDHLGFGLSPRPAGADYRPQAHARRFARLRERLGLTRYSLVVHDFGGPIALDAALDDPGAVDHIIVFNSFAWPFGDTAPTRAMARLAGTGLFRLLYRHANMSFVIARSAWGDRRTMSAATWAPYLPVFPDPDSRERVLFALAKSMAGESAFFDSLWRRLDRFASARVHLVWGMRDSAFPPSALTRFQQAWPQATTLRLDAAGHWPHEEQPAACVAAVRQVLAER